MMANNWQRLNIWLSIGNKFDYTEFTTACAAAGVEPQSALEFAQKAGIISCGIAAYPELPTAEAYLKFLQTTQTDVAQQGNKSVSRTTASGCSSCGGGKVL
jgi:hypothetical protein